MNRRKQFRAVATRLTSSPSIYQATVCVADIFIWLRAKPDQPTYAPLRGSLRSPLSCSHRRDAGGVIGGLWDWACYRATTGTSMSGCPTASST
jgi:hypothetical protein